MKTMKLIKNIRLIIFLMFCDISILINRNLLNFEYSMCKLFDEIKRHDCHKNLTKFIKNEFFIQ